MKKFWLLFFLIILAFPSISLAGSYTATIKGTTTTITFEGLVPCGKCVTVYPALETTISDQKYCNVSPGITHTTTKYIPCQFCHFFVMFKEIIDFLLFKLVFPLAVLMIAIAGIMYIGGIFEFIPGGIKTITQAKAILSSVVIGLLIIFSAWIIINLFFHIIGVAEWTGLGERWWVINCPIEI